VCHRLMTHPGRMINTDNVLYQQPTNLFWSPQTQSLKMQGKGDWPSQSPLFPIQARILWGKMISMIRMMIYLYRCCCQGLLIYGNGC